jgi:hypothetical protein
MARTNITVPMSAEMRGRLAQMAAAEQRSLAGQVRHLLEQALVDRDLDGLANRAASLMRAAHG